MMDFKKPGAVPTAILQALSGGACYTLEQLVTSVGVTNRQVSNGAARLLRRDYLMRMGIGCYQLTEAGLAAAAAGEVITSGPKGALTSVRKARNTFRQRAWRSMRIRRRFTVGDVVADAQTDADGNAQDNAARYIAQLRTAGFVVALPRRQAGTAPTSNGFKLFMISRDTGPLAPVFITDRRIVHDLNTGEDMPCCARS